MTSLTRILSERQLKHRLFKKWNIKKNIKRQDLSMLSFLVEKRKEAGTDAKILYHGQDLAQYRIERACKRRKVPSLLFPQGKYLLTLSFLCSLTSDHSPSIVCQHLHIPGPTSSGSPRFPRSSQICWRLNTLMQFSRWVQKCCIARP